MHVGPGPDNRVSTTFNPRARLAAANGHPPNVALVSSDSVRFFVHTAVLRAASSNDFEGLLSTNSQNIQVAQSGPALNVLLHSVYGLDVTPYAPDWDTLKEAIEVMHRYAVPPPSPPEPLFALLFSHVHRPGGAEDLYVLSAQFGPNALAVSASEHLLSLDLSSITDEWAAQCGAIYLKRLFFLHLGRIQALKRIVAVPLALHAPRAGCSRGDQQQNVHGPWTYAVAQLIADARPDLPISLIEGRLNPLAYRSSCAQCAEIMTARIRAIKQEWSNVKRTI
ncbi:hypothetical protein EXIGLDRAFT_681709 [Exidia glandulosa HHB12029]|uniref:BTB domain-containing protein n=1 Tax=Exidia glandulosa HHB12029 TaxID=1314781 RepID=A0A165DXD8_EXIGL|nr:hypothetical protein EXIGLDRAFT_681709 [Exidia glandulosa HHB12029]